MENLEYLEKEFGPLPKKKEISEYSPVTGLTTDYGVNVLSGKILANYKLQKGRITQEEFDEELKKPLETYEQFLKCRRSNSELREAIKKANPLHLKKLNETVRESKNLHLMYREDPSIIDKYESRLRNILEGH